MATIEDICYDTLSFIMILLVQSSDGAKQLARILSVCRQFLVFKQDVYVLKFVRFDSKCNKFLMCQDINSLLVRCAEAGNKSAQYLLGKVILLNCSQLCVSIGASPSCTLAANVIVQNTRMASFLSYFLPSESSRTRLIHYQLVKVFLLRCSHHDLSTMGTCLRAYIHNYSRVTKEDSPLFQSVNQLLFCASCLRRRENLKVLRKSLDNCYQVYEELTAQHENELSSRCHDCPSSSSAEGYFHDISSMYSLLSNQFRYECKRAAVDWHKGMNVGATYFDNCIREAYIDFGACRDEMLRLYDLTFS